jgi:hypothetical protein
MGDFSCQETSAGCPEDQNKETNSATGALQSSSGYRFSEYAYRQIAKSATDTVSGAVSALKADAREEEQKSSVMSEVA